MSERYEQRPAVRPVFQEGRVLGILEGFVAGLIAGVAAMLAIYCIVFRP